MTTRHTETPGSNARGFAFELVAGEHGLQLRALHHPQFAPLVVDWTSAAQRRRIAAGRNQLLARAVGLHKLREQTVLDATAGLGRDAFTLAALGAEVTLIERQPLLASLLRDARERALTDPHWHETAARMRILEADAAAILASDQRWDVVHLDPMYPHRDKRALPQKEMQLLRELCGGDADAGVLLLPALAACRRRVVVKRPCHAPFLADHPPSFQLKGTQARYDVYVPSSTAA